MEKLKYIGFLMLVLAIIFVGFALNHPEKSFPWSNTITYIIYGVYIIVMLLMFILPIIRKKK